MVLAFCFLASIVFTAVSAARIVYLDKNQIEDETSFDKATAFLLIGFVTNLALSMYYVVKSFWGFWL